MNIRQLEYVLSLSETLNFTKTAEKLYVSQTAVTQQLMSLEKEIGVRLFDRSRRHVELTPAGKVFVPEARDIVMRLKKAVEKCRSANAGITGSFNMGVVKDFIDSGLIGNMERFVQTYPNIKPHFIRASVSELNVMLDSGALDIIITPKFKQAEQSEVSFHLLGTYPLLCAMRSSHPLASQDVVGIDELASEHILLRSTGEIIDVEIAIMLKTLHLSPEKFSIEFIADAESMLYFAATLQGVAILPSFVNIPPSFGSWLRIVKLDHAPTMDIVAVWRKDNANPALSHLLEVLTSMPPAFDA